MRLAGDHGLDAGCRRDRCQDRATPGQQALGRRIGAVGVGSDESATGACSAGCHGEAVVVEVAMHPHHYDVDRLGERLPRVDHRLRPRLHHRFHDAGSGSNEHAIARLDELCHSHGGTHDVAASRDADDGECLLVIRERGRRVVGDEQHPSSGGSQR